MIRARRSLSKKLAKDRGTLCLSVRLLGKKAAHFLETLGTNILPLELDDVFLTVAEDAGRLKLFQYDGRPIHINLQGVFLLDIQSTAQLDGQNDTPQFVHLSDNASGFHKIPPFDLFENPGRERRPEAVYSPLYFNGKKILCQLFLSGKLR
jgi:hypothetical protein